MTKYEVYADGENRPIKKLKHEYEAINFINDVRNLARYGCLTLVKESGGDEPTSVWDNQTNTWKPLVDPEPQLEGYV